MVRVHDTPFVLIPVMMPVSLLPVTIAIDFMCTIVHSCKAADRSEANHDLHERMVVTMTATK